MANKLERLEVQIAANIKDLKKGCEDAKKLVRQAAAEGKAAANISGSGVDKKTQGILKKIKAINSAISEFKNKARLDAGLEAPTKDYIKLQNAIKKTTDQIATLKQKQSALGDERGIPTTQYAAHQESLAKIQAEIDDVIRKQEEWESLGYGRDQIAVLDSKIEELDADARRCEEAMRSLEQSGGAFTTNEKWQILQADIDAATRELQAYEREEARLRAQNATTAPTRQLSHMRNLMAYAGAGADAAISRLPTRIQAVIKKVQQMGQAVAGSRRSVKKHFEGMANDVRKAVGWLGRLGTGFGKVFSKIPLLNKFNIGLGRSNSQLKRLRSGLMSGLGLRGMLSLAGAGALVYLALNNARKGMERLVASGGRTSQSVGTLKASLTQLQNSLATAFAPILNYVTPALATLINYLSAAATWVAKFFAAMTGQKTVEVATSVGSGVAAGMGDAAGATNDANEAAEKYRRTLMGFDQINKLDDPTKNSGSGGSGGGTGAGGIGTGFETIDVGPNKWADMIKEAWENADFTEIGQILGRKLNAAMESIPWDEIKETARKIAKSIATFLNGFIGEVDWTLVGKTIAEGVNTAIEFAYTFITTFDWAQLGTAIGDTINGFFENVDWSKLGKTISEGIKGALTTGITALETIDFKKIGSSLADLVANIDWIELATKIVTLLGDALIGVINLLSGFVEGIGKYIADYFKSGDVWNDLKAAGGAILDLSVRIGGAAWELLQTIMQSGLSIAATLAGDAWDSIKNLAGKTLKYTAEKVGKVWDDIRDMVGKTLKYAAEKAGSVWGSIKDMAGKTLNYYADRAGKTWDTIKSMAGKTLNYYASRAGKVWSTIQNMKGKTLNYSAKLVGGVWNTLKKFGGGIVRFVKGKGKAEGGIYRGGSWHPVTAAASGGVFDEGQMFIAREAGPELVGTIGGNTAVMNNDQIVSSVSAGVARAVAAVMGSGGSGKEVHLYLEGDAKNLFKIVRIEAENYMNSTGETPFPV